MKNINKILEDSKINKEYEELKKLNKKSTNEEIVKTIKKINEINKKVYEKCKNKKLRQEKVEMYIDKQKAEIIKKILKQLNIETKEKLKEYVIIIGDWGGNNNLKNNKSTMGMKRLLRKYVKNMYLIDEYNTSKISNENYSLFSKKGKEEEYLCEEYKIEISSICKKTKEKKVINKKMHEILTFKTEKKHIKGKNLLHEKKKNGKIRRFIQRDKNAVLNFKTISTCIFEGKEKPLAFKRNNDRK
jgi:hypothetical protein